MTPASQPRTEDEIQASLAPPGAGIPMPMRYVLRWFVKPIRIRRSSVEACERQLRSAHRRVAQELADFPPDLVTRRVLVAPQMGLEDSSRFWSAAMLARHLTIVGSEIEGLIGALSRGRTIDKVADTAKVKPEQDRNEPAAIAEYLAFGDGLADRLIRDVTHWESPAKHEHPWFGMMTAKDWFWLLGMHTGLHLRQLRGIRAGLGERRL